MRKIHTQKFINGMGSVLNLLPQKRYSDAFPLTFSLVDRTPVDTIGQDWKKVGQAISKAMAGSVDGNRR